MEFRHPIFTEVLSSPKPTQLSHVIDCASRTSFTLVNIPSAVEDDAMHISKNWVATWPRLTSKILIVNGFIFCTPLSLDPSMHAENGVSFIEATRFSLKCGQSHHLQYTLFSFALKNTKLQYRYLKIYLETMVSVRQLVTGEYYSGPTWRPLSLLHR